jgi:hypothetical protein
MNSKISIVVAELLTGVKFNARELGWATRQNLGGNAGAFVAKFA